jgi:hypothetical protein
MVQYMQTHTAVDSPDYMVVFARHDVLTVI